MVGSSLFFLHFSFIITHQWKGKVDNDVCGRVCVGDLYSFKGVQAFCFILNVLLFRKR